MQFKPFQMYNIQLYINPLSQKNEVIFERHSCVVGNSSKIVMKECWMKKTGHIGTDRVSFLAKITGLQPIPELQVHLVVYREHQTYRKYAVDIWEDICEWLNKKKRSFWMDWTFGRAIKYIKYDGGEWKCPIKEGNLTINYKNISLNEESPLIPLVPSGSKILQNFYRK